MDPTDLPSGVSTQKPFDAAKGVRIISTVTIVLVGLLAVASFALSFEALWQLAASSGAISPGRAWLFPLAVDGSIIVFSISALRSSLAGENGRWSMALVVLVTVASIILNIAHAPTSFLAGFVSALPPLLLFLSFESLMRQIHSTLHVGAPAKQKNIRMVVSMAPPTQIQQPDNKSETAGESQTNEQVADRRETARRLLEGGSSKKAVARELRMSLTTVRRIAADLVTA